MRPARPATLFCTWILLTAGPAAGGIVHEEGIERILSVGGGRADTAAEKTAGSAAAARENSPALFCPLEEELFDDAADGRLDRISLLEAALVANGVDQPEALKRYQGHVDRLVAELKRSGKLTGPPRRRAQVIFEFMHGRVLHGGYRIDGTDLAAAIDHGRFNCVSASVVFSYLAGQLGLKVRGLEMPSHAMCRVFLPAGPIDVETTCPGWFRLLDDPQRQAELVDETVGRRPEFDCRQAREVSSVQMAAMIYYNRGVDLLAQKRFQRAALANAKAVRLDPASLTARGNLMATINNWAIALGDSGDYAGAGELLRRGFAMDPDYQTFALNYVHLHHQWTEHLCGDGRFEEALEVLARAAAEMPDREYLRRAPWAVYRRWAAALFEQGETDRAFALFARAQRQLGCGGELLEAAINDRGLTLLRRGQFRRAVDLFDRGLAARPDAQRLRENRRMAAMGRAGADAVWGGQ